jgi:hypothetical protein
MRPRKHFIRTQKAWPNLGRGWAVFACTGLLSLSRAGRKALSAHWTLDTLKVDAPNLGRRNQSSAFRAYRIERCPHFFSIDLPRSWHDPTILIRDRMVQSYNAAHPHVRRLGLNPPPSAEANLSSRCLSAKARQFSTLCVCYRTVRSDYLKRSIACLVRRVYNCARKHFIRTQKAGPTFFSARVGPFLRVPVSACRDNGV